MSLELKEIDAQTGAAKAAGTDPAKRAQILQGAREIFMTEGFDAASMGEIARAAGVSKGTLYVYFESKEKLFTELIREERAGQAEQFFQIDEDADVRTALTELGLSFVKKLTSTRSIAFVRIVLAASEKFPHIGEAFYETGPRCGIDRVRDYLAAQIAKGALATDDPELAAMHFLELCKAGIMLRSLFNIQPQPSPERQRYMIERAVAVFMAAYGPKGA